VSNKCSRIIVGLWLCYLCISCLIAGKGNID
jgi:hypothetical protein